MYLVFMEGEESRLSTISINEQLQKIHNGKVS
jgi:hypothetical protein